MRRRVAVGVIALLVGCSDAVEEHADGDRRGPADSAGDAVETGRDCPRVLLPSATRVRYEGDTSGLKNLVTSARLGWAGAPDDALAFTAPEAGRYEFVTTTEPSQHGGCGASVWDYGAESLYDERWCPSVGSTTEIDGFYATAAYSYALAAGQTVIVWFSCADGAAATAGQYSLTITQR